MKMHLILLALCFCLLAHSQDKGIHWANNLTWAEVLKKAKEENKYIFLDLYATWCQPCHRMDNEFYRNEEVGRVINDKFLAVKVQMDKTDNDDEQVKKWYSEATRMGKNYVITAFPTFLFFYPDGKPMHRDVGYKTRDEFIGLVKDALDSQKQYYSILNHYQPGKLDTVELKGLARQLKHYGGELAGEMAVEYLTRIPKSELSKTDNISFMTEFSSNPKIEKIAFDYLCSIPTKDFIKENNRVLISYFSSVPEFKNLVLDYLSKQNNKMLKENLRLLNLFSKDEKAKKIFDRYTGSLAIDSLFTKDNLFLLRQFTKSTKDKGFSIFFKCSDRADKVFNFKGVSNAIVLNILMNEEYNRQYYAKAIKEQNDDIPWDSIKAKVKQKYGEYYADRLDLHVKASLYRTLAEKDDKFWTSYINYFIEENEKYGWDTLGPSHKFSEAVQINSFVYNAIFLHSNDKEHIETGLKWMVGIMRRNPTDANEVDTYASLLYKLGRTDEAIKFEEKALKMALEDSSQQWVLSSIQDTLSKMKLGIPIWIKTK